MGFKCGLVGLPNVGKTTLFSALTGAKAEIANYPFSTKEPNNVLVEVPDVRLNRIAELIPPQKLTPAVVEFVDIAGIAQGSGSGDGKQFLSHVRETDALIHVVRCFEDENVFHVESTIDPVRDVETINIELMLTDLEICTKRMETLKKSLRAGKKEGEALNSVLERCIASLEDEKPLRLLEFDEKETGLLKDLQLLTTKKVLYVANIPEDAIENGNELSKKLAEIAAAEETTMIPICAQLEAELAQMEEEERQEFFKELNLKESSLAKLIRAGYQLLGFGTFFTAGRKEVRAWTFPAGAFAPKAAGVIHSDFEKGFIRAAVYHCDELFELKNEKAIKEAGRMRMEGKDYPVKDGDVILFHFN